ncbi:unnamed protein product [Dovyalis caffra]|uniref:Yippee domain-containing protein n=1 Tax=Dovyalis caffra TaxID=77055 RepID=A0AAV1QNH0_9ROSI|nr:unnamed protein product [Dovyalis caffra]
MGRLYIETVKNSEGEEGEEGEGIRKIFKCKCCKVEFASHRDILSKNFQGRFGRAYLFKNVTERRAIANKWIAYCLRYLLYFLPANVGLEILYNRRVSEKAYEESQKYKEGMYILEKERMLKEGW